MFEAIGAPTPGAAASRRARLSRGTFGWDPSPPPPRQPLRVAATPKASSTDCCCARCRAELPGGAAQVPGDTGGGGSAVLGDTHTRGCDPPPPQHPPHGAVRGGPSPVVYGTWGGTQHPLSRCAGGVLEPAAGHRSPPSSPHCTSHRGLPRRALPAPPRARGRSLPQAPAPQPMEFSTRRRGAGSRRPRPLRARHTSAPPLPSSAPPTSRRATRWERWRPP